MSHAVLGTAAFLGGKAARGSVGSGYTYWKSALAFALTLQGVQPCIVLAKRAVEVLDIVAKSMDLTDEVGCQTVDFFVKFGGQASVVLMVKQYAQ